MTFNEKGLLRAMKRDYKNAGYVVAGTDYGYIITGEMWGVSVHEKAIPNTVKSLIVLHAGKLPDVGKAINVRKDDISNWIYEMAVDGIESLDALYREKKREVIRPTRLTMDSYRLWQLPGDLQIRLIDPEKQQILDYTDNDTYLIKGAIYGTTVYGSVYVCCEAEVDEDRPLLVHLEQMQWIPVEVPT